MTAAAGPWLCFHCEEVFTDREQARLHFGADSTTDPICKLRMPGEYHLINVLRDQEQQLERYRAEDSEILRAMYSMQAEHGAALRREEEKGFERGVKDMRKMYQVLLDELHTHFGCDPECEKRHLHVTIERIASNGT